MSDLIRFVFLLLVVLGCSCTEEFHLDTDKSQPSKLVVECELLDIDSIHYVRLRLSKMSFSKNEIDDTRFNNKNWFQPVTDAKVIISDNHSYIDTLVAEPDSIYVYKRYDPQTKNWLLGRFSKLNEFSNSKGYYSTRKLKISAGKIYYLNILWNGKQYTSSCFVPKAPAIDSVKFIEKQGETGKNNFNIPYIYFKDDPSTIDYYLFKTSGIYSAVWSRVVLSDEFLTNNVKGIDVFKGETVSYWLNAYPIAQNEPMTYRIEMHSITKEKYAYYKSLTAQFRNDGGIYTPSPSSPPTNITNGALGCFSVSCVKVYEYTTQ